MTNKSKGIRLPESAWERVEALVEAMKAAGEDVRFGTITEALVLRHLVAEGLPILEARYGIKKG